MNKSEFKLRFKGKAAVFIDWANVYGWTKSLKKEVDPSKQVVVIFAHGHMGKEVYQINNGIFTKAIDKLGVDLFV